MGSVKRSPNLGDMHHRSRKSGLKSRSTQLLAIRFGWVVVVIWYEVGTFFSSLSSCRFPDSILRKVSDVEPTHVVLVADPHVPHPILSHPEEGPQWLNAFKQGMEELFMRKSWNVVKRLGRIDAVIMVGDMLDEGRGHLSDEEYEDYYKLFRSIFTLPSDVPMYFAPGNNDLPLGDAVHVSSPRARQRYLEHFGQPNQVITIADHSIVLLDAIGLVDEDYRRNAAEVRFGEWDPLDGGVIQFVRNIAQSPLKNPILVSHIPLARSASASCGPLREHGRIQKGVGLGYQNLLGSETSNFLLRELRPNLVFSGDDHDYCEVMHPGHVKEVTIKSFSSNAGVRRPGLQLLSLVPPVPGQTSRTDTACLLPDQFGVYRSVYMPLVILTVVFLLWTNIRTAWSRANKSKSRHWDTDEKQERFVSLTLPSRRSAQHLHVLSRTSVPRDRYRTPNLSPAPSAPPSPLASPRLGAHPNDADLPEPHSPALSRRSSYGTDLNNADGSGTLHPGRRTASSGLLPIPSNAAQPSPRRVTLPRILSASDWVSAAKAKDVSVLSLVVDSARKGRLSSVRGFFRWLWRARNNVFVKTTREMISIAVPAIIVWALMNSMFFGWT